MTDKLYFTVGKDNVRLFVSALVIHILRLDRSHVYTIQKHSYEGLITALYRKLGKYAMDYRYHPDYPCRVIHGDYLAGGVLKNIVNIITMHFHVDVNMSSAAKLLRLSIEAGSQESRVRIGAINRIKTFLDLPKEGTTIIAHAKSLLGGGDYVTDLGNGFYNVKALGEEIFIKEYIGPFLEDGILELVVRGDISATPYVAFMSTSDRHLVVTLLPDFELKEKENAHK